MGYHYCRARGRLYDWCSVSAACALTGQVRSLLLRCWRTNQQAGLKHLRIRRGQGEGRLSRPAARVLIRRDPGDNGTMLNCSHIRASSGNLAESSNVPAVPVNTYIWVMPRSVPSSATLDLFDYVPSAPDQHTRRTLPKVTSLPP